MIRQTRWGKTIYATNDGIQVRQNWWYRWLMFGESALHSCIHRHYPERPVLEYIDPFTTMAREQPGKTCLLGLGGAAVAHRLGAVSSQMPMDIVEINPDIIQIAHRYFMLDRLPHVTVHQADANVFLQQTAATYQHILIDLFDHHQFPSHCHHAAFFEACWQRLLPQGVLAINIANATDHDSLLHLIRHYFHTNTLALPVKRTANLVILAFKTPGVTDYLLQWQQQDRLNQHIWDPHWGWLVTFK